MKAERRKEEETRGKSGGKSIQGRRNRSRGREEADKREGGTTRGKKKQLKSENKSLKKNKIFFRYQGEKTREKNRGRKRRQKNLRRRNLKKKIQKKNQKGTKKKFGKQKKGTR